MLKEKNVGFTIFDNNKFKLEDGKQQIVIRVSKLVIKQGQKEKFKSEPLIISLDLENVDLEIFPERDFLYHKDIKGFDKKPVVLAKVNGKEVVVQQEILERGAGMTRDYAAELKVQNGFDNVSEVVAVAPVVTTPKVASSPIKMSQDLFVKASETEKEQFTDWAFKNRKSIKAPLDGEGKILPMLEYWYEKADADEKAEILTWILAK